MLADQIGEAQQDFLLLHRIGVAPDAAVERAPGGRDRAVDVGGAAIGDLSEDLAVDRRDFGERRPARRRDVGAVDEGAAFDGERRGAGEPGLRGWWDDRALVLRLLPLDELFIRSPEHRL